MEGILRVDPGLPLGRIRRMFREGLLAADGYTHGLSPSLFFAGPPTTHRALRPLEYCCLCGGGRN